MTIQTTARDWVISGHGSTSTAKRLLETRVPDHVEFVMLAPPGAALTNRLGQALERGDQIGALKLVQNGRSNEHSPSVYSPGQNAPNLTLHFISPRDIATPTTPHVIGVGVDTDLDALWSRIPANGGVVRVYWAACGGIDGDTHGPMVDLA